MIKKPWCLSPCLVFLICTATQAKVEHDKATQLGQTLTPTGATHAGNQHGIPTWQDISAVDPKEQPILTLTANNYHLHQQHLSAGQVALFKTYPDTFKMNIYPSHRTFAAPQWVYDNTRENATSTTLNENQTGFLNAKAGIPFPIPQSAVEVYFNHLARWRGIQLVNHASDANVNSDGAYSISSRESLLRYDYYLPGSANPNRLFSALSKTTAPATRAGSGGLILEPIDQIKEPRSAWLWDKGRRRVIRAPNVSYDQPVNSAAGMRTADDTDMVNGSPDRFDLQLLESRTMYISYNNDRLNAKTLKYQDLLQPGHLNPAHTRYELHRVWVIRATLKDQWRHTYSQRDFYLDEDSWSVAVADLYDKQGRLFRVSLSYLHQDPDMPGTFPVVNVYHDITTRKYHVMGLQNESPKGNVYDAPPAKDNRFTPNGLKRFVK